MIKGIQKKVQMLQRARVRREKRDDSGFLDATPIGDLSFLLFIFFIVTSSFILREGIFLSLPSARAGAVRLAPEQVLEVRPENEGFRIGNRLLTRDAFASELRRFKDSGPDKVLIIRMSLRVKYDRLVDTLSVARENGMRKVSLQNEGG